MGSVGYVMPSLVWRLEALEELGHDPLGDPPRGELCLKGKSLFSGYHKA